MPPASNAQIATLKLALAEADRKTGALTHEWNAAEAQIATLTRKLEMAERALWDIHILKRSIMIDVGSCHSQRGPGASSEMRSDDRDLRNDMKSAFDKIGAALTAIRESGHEG